MAQGTWYTLTEAADEPSREVACRVILRRLWPNLALFDIDLAGLHDDVAVGDAVENLSPYRVRKKRSQIRTDIVELRPRRDDQALESVLQLLTRTVGSAGFSADDWSMLYDVNDGGTSCAFRLTPIEFVDIEQTLKCEGAPPSLLVPLASR